MEIKIKKAAELWDTVISTHLQFFFFFTLLAFIAVSDAPILLLSIPSFSQAQSIPLFSHLLSPRI